MQSRLPWLSGLALALATTQVAVAQEDIIAGATPQPGGEIIVRTAIAEDEDPVAAGKAAALALKEAMGEVEPHIVLVTECFEDRPFKVKVLDGVAHVFERERLCGGASYGMFTQGGVKDVDAVAEIVEATLEEIYEALKRGECVSLRHFGMFHVRPERKSWVFKFNPSQRLRKLFGWSSSYKGKL